MAKGLNEFVGTLNRHDLAGWPDDLRQIRCDIARACADIDDALAYVNAGTLPAVENVRAPHPVLQTKSL